jgi:phosphoribosylformylglycinamidine synthase
MAVLDDVRKCVTMDLKDPREGVICLIEPADDAPLSSLASTHRAVAKAIAAGHVQSCHDVSEGGYLTAVAEMCIGSGLGAKLNAEADTPNYFAEGNARYVVELHAMGVDAVRAILKPAGATLREIGRTTAEPILQISRLTPERSEAFECHAFVDDLTKAWRGTLDW